MEESIFKNTRKHEDQFNTGDISKEFKKYNDFDVRHKTLEALDVKTVKDDSLTGTFKMPAKLALAHGVDYQLERKKSKRHVGFSRLYTEIEEGDSKYMKSVRRTLGRFFDYKEMSKDSSLTPNQRQWLLEVSMNTLGSLINACNDYASNRKIRLFKRAKDRRTDVRRLKERAEKELATMKEKYVTFMDKKVSKKDAAPVSVDEQMVELKVKRSKKGNKKIKLDLSKLDLNETSDRDMFTKKHHMLIRSELDMKKEILTADEKALLKKINDYSKIRATAALAEFYRDMSSSGYKNTKKELEKERKLVKEISAELLKMKKDGPLSEEKEKIFSLYMNSFLHFQTGSLDMTKVKGKVLEYNDQDMQMVDNRLNEDRTWSHKAKLNIKDRTDEPLFAHEPCMSDVVQRSMGNCFLLSAIAELAAKDSQAILDMMKDDGKTVTVRLYAVQGIGSGRNMYPVYVKVDKRVAQEAALDCLWVQILCKAYAAFIREHHAVSEEEFKRVYKPVNDVYFGDADKYDRNDKHIDYGYISNGGRSDEVMPVLTGRMYRKSDDIMGAVEEVETDADVIKIMHEAKYTDEQQERLIKSGRIFNLDVAYMEESKDKYDNKLEKPIQMVYIKEVYDQLEDNLNKVVDRLYNDYPVQKEKSARLNKGDEKKLTLTAKYSVELYAGKLMSADEKYKGLSRDEFMKYLAGDEKIEANNKKLYEELAVKLKNSYKNAFKEEKGDEESQAKRKNKLRDMNPDDFMQYIKEILSVEGKESEYGEIHEEIVYDKKSKSVIPKRPEDEEEALRQRKELTTKLKIAVLRQTSVVINDIENGIFMHEGNFHEEEDKDKKYKAMAELTETMSVAKYKNKNMSIADNLYKLARLLGTDLETAMEHVKRAMKAKYRVFREKQEEVSNLKNTQIFTGVYNSTALKMYNSIKSELKAGKKIEVGSRAGWGKKNARGETKDKGTVGNHAYSVLGVKDVKFKGKRIHMVKLRNPWGSYTTQYIWNEKTKEMEFDTEYAENSGVFYMELTHFSRVFDKIYNVGDENIQNYFWAR